MEAHHTPFVALPRKVLIRHRIRGHLTELIGGIPISLSVALVLWVISKLINRPVSYLELAVGLYCLMQAAEIVKTTLIPYYAFKARQRGIDFMVYWEGIAKFGLNRKPGFKDWTYGKLIQEVAQERRLEAYRATERAVEILTPPQLSSSYQGNRVSRAGARTRSGSPRHPRRHISRP